MEIAVKFRLLIATLFAATGALAEDAPSAPPADFVTSPPGPVIGQKFYLEVDAADLDVISKGLVELPFRISNPLLLKLNGQLRAQEQLKAAADKALTDPVEKAKKRK